MAKLRKADRLFIRQITQKCSKASSALENSVPELSLAHGVLNLYEQRIKEPEVFRPLREYNQKNDDTPLPAENLQSNWRDLSIRSLMAWEKWTNPEGEPFKLPNDDTLYHPLSQEELNKLLDEEETQAFQQYKKDVEENDKKWKEEEEESFKHITSVVPNWSSCEIGLIKRDTYNRTFEDYNFNGVISKHETEVWRPPAKKEEAHLAPNCGFRDDPDYIPPINSSWNFTTTPPATRIFNATFRVYTKAGKIEILHPDKNVAKDYTDKDDIYFLYQQKGIEITNVVVEFERHEIDLRVTYSNAPDPKKYKKVDPLTPAGTKLMKLLNEQPNIWKEYSWEYASDEGTVKKVAYGLTFGAKDQDKVTYWVYLNDQYVKGKNIIYNKKPQPIVRYEGTKDKDNNCHKLFAYLTYHTSNRFVKATPKYKEENPDAAEFVIDNLVNKLINEGYIHVKSSEDTFGLVTEMYIHKDSISRKARDKFILTEAEWNSKYGSNKA